MFTFGFFLGLFVAFVEALLRNSIKDHLLYKVIHSNQKTTVLEEQTIRQKHVLVKTSVFANRAIRPGDIVIRAQFQETTRALGIDFLPLLKKDEEKEILKSHGVSID